MRFGLFDSMPTGNRLIELAHPLKSHGCLAIGPDVFRIGIECQSQIIKLAFIYG